MNIIRVSNSLNPDQDQHSVCPDLDLNCLPVLPRPENKFWKIEIFYRSERSGNFIFSQVNLERKKKVNGGQQASENYIFYKLQAIFIQEHSYSNINGLRFSFKDLMSKQ